MSTAAGTSTSPNTKVDGRFSGQTSTRYLLFASFGVIDTNDCEQTVFVTITNTAALTIVSFLQLLAPYLPFLVNSPRSTR